MRVFKLFAALGLTLLFAARAFALQPTQGPLLSDAIAIQLALDRAGFSPGLIDGKLGPKTVMAVSEFQRSRGLPSVGSNGVIDGPTLAALQIQPGPLATCIITSDDLTKVTGVTTDWLKRSQMKYLGYESPADMIAEKFHTSRNCLIALNPGINLDQLTAGDTLNVPQVITDGATPQAARLDVNLAEKVIRAIGADGKTVALFHCSIAKDKAKRPTGSARVTAIALDPTYRFDPAMWPEVKNVKQKLLIPPGPRNPVGLAWISLSLPGYGMHGTPNPENIGKTGSHGCFRLTNWDAQRLAKIIRPGAQVTFKSDTATAVATAQ